MGINVPSAALSHILFLLRGSEIPTSGFSRMLRFLSIPPPCPAPVSSAGLAPFPLHSLKSPSQRRSCREQSQCFLTGSLPLESHWPAVRHGSSWCPQHSQFCCVSGVVNNHLTSTAHSLEMKILPPACSHEGSPSKKRKM